MKKTDVEPIKTYLEDFFKEIYSNFKHKDPKILLKIQASLKEHVLKRICTYCRKKVDYKSFKTESEIHDYHNSGMCKKCSEEILLEPNTDLKWLN